MNQNNMNRARNNLAPRPNSGEKKPSAVTFTAGGQQITLTPETVKAYLVSGDPQNVTYQELAMFINLCKFNGLNPWLREAYLIKFGTSPATMVVGKEAYMKRAEAHQAYDGFEAGIIVCDPETGEIMYRTGCFTLEGENIVGGWAEVWRKDRKKTFRIEVPIGEYIGKKKNGEVNGQWATKPATMIRKVALSQALREAFPSLLGGMFTAEEQGVDEPEGSYVPEAPVVEIPEETVTGAQMPPMGEPDSVQEPVQRQQVNSSNAAQQALFG